MKITIALPSHRSDNATIGRILQLDELDENKFEVIVRDNSNSEKKKQALIQSQPKVIKHFFSADCDMYENYRETLKLTSGDAVLFLADDDMVFPDGLNGIYESMILAKNQDYKVFSGTYLVTGKNKAFIYKYPELNSPSAQSRILDFVSSNAPHHIFYSITTKKLASDVFKLQQSLPFSFSYSDQLLVLFMLCSSRVLQSDRLFYRYNLSEWEPIENGIFKDRMFYEAAGLDPEVDSLHYLLQAAEGAALLRSKLVKEITNESMDMAARAWFIQKYSLFLRTNRPVNNNSVTAKAALKLKEKLKSEKTIELPRLISDIARVFALSNRQKASDFVSYWSSL